MELLDAAGEEWLHAWLELLGKVHLRGLFFVMSS